MKLGIISGSGLYDFCGVCARDERVDTPYGSVDVAIGDLSGHETVWLSRHGKGHLRLSNKVSHRANVWAMRACAVEAIVGVTAVGVIDPAVPLGCIIIFDDLFFPSNRMPEGDLATYFERVADPLRGHWIPARPYSRWLGERLAQAASSSATPAVVGGCYVHADGPRFNTAAEHRWMRSVGGTAVSQTCGPETVLAAELGVPYALVGYGVNYVSGLGNDDAVAETALDELLAKLRTTMVALLTAFAGLVPVNATVPREMGDVFRIGR